jgi:4-amino-4-deoxy-L-arabinose transferase-like glycosyltransferase
MDSLLRRRAEDAGGRGTQPDPPQRDPGAPRRMTGLRLSRLRPSASPGWAAAVGGVLLLSFLLRVWGVDHGLPYAYNADENAHFVPKAIGLFGHGWNPHYFVNPPAFTYLLHVVFVVWFGGRKGVSDALATDPTAVFVVARVTAAAVGTLAVGLLYLAGTRLFDRRVGLLAAGLMGVSFLPAFYSHLALNDVPTLAPICLALWGAAGMLRYGRMQDYAVAGIGLGLACATKYTGGIVLLPLLGAAAAQFLAPGGQAPAVRGLLLAGAASIAAFVVANPYALLAFNEFRDGLTHQTDTAGDKAGKLGNTWDSGWRYYLWTFTWGLGWVPFAAALGGIAALVRDERRLIAVLAPAPLLFVLFMGSQERFFGRWLLPVFPFVCILAAYCVLEVADRLGARRPALRPTLAALAVVALCAQGVVASLHNGLVLSRDDTRNLTRTWMVAHIPPRSKVVVEPVVPDLWAQDIGAPLPPPGNGYRWNKFPTSRSNIDNDGSTLPGRGRVVNIEDYETTLFPALIDRYEQSGYCWVITGFSQRGRAEAQPEVVPRAIAYYQELARRADVVFEASPFEAGTKPRQFNFDWTFNQYPLAYKRPGVVMTVYRLRSGECAR